MTQKFRLLLFFLLMFWIDLLTTSTLLAGESIQNHLILDLNPLVISTHNPIGSGLGLSYNRFHPELKSWYSLGTEVSIPFQSKYGQMDFISSLGFFTEITRAFSIGARVGAVFSQGNSVTGFGALALRLPALYPMEKKFFSFFFEEIDLGIAGSGSSYAAFRLGMLLL